MQKSRLLQFLVMEVACGEHGECVQKLVNAVNDGRCDDFQATLEAIRIPAMNDIAKTQPATINPTALTSPSGVNPNELHGVTCRPGSGGTVISVPESCTTSLLDSAESIKHVTSFPTSSWVQFSILLKRTFLSQIRDMVKFIYKILQLFEKTK